MYYCFSLIALTWSSKYQQHVLLWCLLNLIVKCNLKIPCLENIERPINLMAPNWKDKMRLKVCTQIELVLGVSLIDKWSGKELPPLIIINVQDLFFCLETPLGEKQFSFRSTSPPLPLTLKNFEMRATEVCLVAATLKSDYLKKHHTSVIKLARFNMKHLKRLFITLPNLIKHQT